MEIFLRPLFSNTPEKIYNLKKATELQKPIRKKEVEELGEVMEFGDEAWMEAEEHRRREKLRKYEKSLKYLIEKAMNSDRGEISLEEIRNSIEERSTDLLELIPNVEIFKEIMVELLRSKEISIRQLSTLVIFPIVFS